MTHKMLLFLYNLTVTNFNYIYLLQKVIYLIFRSGKHYLNDEFEKIWQNRH